MLENNENAVVHQARLHVILFFWPILVFCIAIYTAIAFPAFRIPSYILGGIALVWGAAAALTYFSSALLIKKKQVILCTGIWVHQTIDIPLSKIESVDIRQSILGSLLQYGSLVITGTGGTRQCVAYLNKPLTCRRYIEQLMHG